MKAFIIDRYGKKDGDEYVDGQILDPDNGKVYRCKVHLTDGGKKLSVRGYIGVPMLGRSQTWYARNKSRARQEAS